MIQLNKFLTKASTMLAPMLLKNDSWTFPTENIQIASYDNNMFLIKNKKDYTVYKTIEHITPGVSAIITSHTILATAEYNNILFMLIKYTYSYGNPPATYNYTTIATYPSPYHPTYISYNQNINAYEYSNLGSVYGFYDYCKPIFNLQQVADPGKICACNIPISNFTTSNSSYAKMTIAESYDKTVNIILTIEGHANKIIPTNFNVYTGEVYSFNGNNYTGKYILNNKYYIDNYINQQALSPFDIELSFPTTGNFIEYEDGGELKPGNYFFFFRYTDKYYKTTKFTNSTGVVSIFNDGRSKYTTGVQDKNWITLRPNKTTKRLRYTIDSGYDEYYEYMEVAVVRYTVDNENSVARPEVYLIDNRYKLTDELYIYGNEKQLSISIEDLFPIQRFFNESKTQMIYDNRWFGANWKSKQRDESSIIALASDIELEDGFEQFHTDSDKKLIDLVQQSITDFTEHQMYMNPKNIATRIGYFDYEIYPFAIMAKYTDGSYSQAYPVKGNFGSGGAISNAKGLFKFGDVSYPVNRYNYLASRYVKLNASSQSDVTDFISSHTDIQKLYLLRGERQQNIIYSGMLCKTIKGFAYNNNGSYQYKEFENGKIIPHIGQRTTIELDGTPGTIVTDNGVPTTKYNIDNEEESTGWEYANSYGVYKEKRYALFASDLFFENENEIKIQSGQTYILEVLNTSSVSTDFYTDANYLPDLYICSEIGSNNLVTQLTSYEVTVYHVPAYTYETGSEFVSYFKDADPSIENDAIAYYENLDDGTAIGNRSIQYPAYIGIVCDQEINFGNGGTVAYVRLKKTDDASYKSNILNTYNVRSNTYSIIPSDINESKIYHGDCFKQPTFFLFCNDNDSDSSEDHVDDNKIHYEHGLFTRIIGHNRKNSQLRNKVIANTATDTVTYNYFPQVQRELSSLSDIKSWILGAVDNDNYRYEAFQLNDSYNQTVSPVKVLGYDENTPVINHLGNRIYVSDKYSLNTTYNAFTNISQTDYKDICLDDGEITELINDDDFVLSVHVNGCNALMINERLIQPESNVIIATIKDIISDEAEKILSYGASSMYHITKGDAGIYGVDVNKKVLWNILTDYTQYRKKFGQGFNLNDTGLIRTDIESAFTYLNNNDIIVTYDPEYRDVYFRFSQMINQTLSYKSFVYNEQLKGFISVDTKDFKAMSRYRNFHMISTIENNSRNVISLLKASSASRRPFKLSYYVNGFISDQESAAMMTKIFESIAIATDNILPSKLIIETDTGDIYEKSILSGKYNSPRYFNGETYIPFPLVRSLPTSIKTPPKGKWLKVTLEYNSTNDITIYSIKSNYKIMGH